MWPPSAVLRTRGDHLAIGEVNLTDQARARAVPRAAGLDHHRLVHRVLEVHLADVAGPEESGWRAFVGPGLDLALLVLDVHEQVGVGGASVVRAAGGCGG